MLVGTVAIYVPGLLWLGMTAGWDKPILAWGLYPFLLGEALKLAIGTMVTRQLLRSARVI
jgi:biotin transport system substrate-specific component